jgi:hypothetical protein
VPTGTRTIGVITFFAGSVAAFTMHAATGDVQRVVLQVQQSVQRAVGLDPHIATAATIAAGLAPPRGTNFSRRKAVTPLPAIPPCTLIFCPIDKHVRNRLRLGGGGFRSSNLRSQIPNFRFKIPDSKNKMRARRT